MAVTHRLSSGKVRTFPQEGKEARRRPSRGPARGRTCVSFVWTQSPLPEPRGRGGWPGGGQQARATLCNGRLSRNELGWRACEAGDGREHSTGVALPAVTPPPGWSGAGNVEGPAVSESKASRRVPCEERAGTPARLTRPDHLGGMDAANLLRARRVASGRGAVQAMDPSDRHASFQTATAICSVLRRSRIPLLGRRSLGAK